MEQAFNPLKTEFKNRIAFSQWHIFMQSITATSFTALKKCLDGKASSLVERVMRTVNMRINVGKWTPSGALDAMNVRLAHYYNDWTPGEPKLKGAKIVRL